MPLVWLVVSKFGSSVAKAARGIPWWVGVIAILAGLLGVGGWTWVKQGKQHVVQMKELERKLHDENKARKAAEAQLSLLTALTQHTTDTLTGLVAKTDEVKDKHLQIVVRAQAEEAAIVRPVVLVTPTLPTAVLPLSSIITDIKSSSIDSMWESFCVAQPRDARCLPSRPQ